MLNAPRGRLLMLASAGSCLLFSLLAGPRPLSAAPDAGLATAVLAGLPSAPVLSIFRIEKSENRNQVHYAVHVDQACRPDGPRPVYGYWRELERGPNVTSRLAPHEQPAYGLRDPQRITKHKTGGEIEISLRAFPKRPLVIELMQAQQSCLARTRVMIQRQPALLTSIYVNIGPLFGVDYALVRGMRLADGRPIQEKLHPSDSP